MGQVALSALGKGTYVDMVPVHKLILYTQVTIKLILYAAYDTSNLKLFGTS